MRTVYLLRHSLTEANARRLYCGSTDLPLAEEGRAIASSRRGTVPPCDICVTSGLRRADETLMLMTGRHPDETLPGLREMDFGAFEMRGYEALKNDPAYIRWIEDASGDVACPGGESGNAFRARVLSAGDALWRLPGDAACVVCHGGVIVQLMEAWFPEAGRGFYDWQPGPCGGYRIDGAEGRPISFQEVSV